jgi:hypothetical protein
LLLLSIPVFFLVQANAATESSSAVEMLTERFIVSPFRKIVISSEDPLQFAQFVPACKDPTKQTGSGFGHTEFSTEGEDSVEASESG